MDKDNVNEGTGHLMVSDHRRPRPRVTPEVQATGASSVNPFM